MLAESQIKVLTFAAWIIERSGWLYDRKGLFTLTTIPSVDSILVACIAYAILSRGKSTPLIHGYTQAMITAESGDSATLPDREPMFISDETLRVIHLVARHQSITTAAEQLNKVPSAISYTIKAEEHGR